MVSTGQTSTITYLECSKLRMATAKAYVLWVYWEKRRALIKPARLFKVATKAGYSLGMTNSW
jgi:hypothetical protein